MASDGPELDLYADDIGDEFAQEYNENDLYDDVLTSNSKQRNNSSGNNNQNSSNNNSSSSGNNQNDSDQFNGGSGAGSNQSNTGVGGGGSQLSTQQQSSQSNNQNSGSGFHSNNLTNNQTNDQTSNHFSSSGHVRKPCVYVGNLTWWTTDEDVIKSLNSINVNDVIEVKFFENRANGQSKGFCVVTMQSDGSVRLALEKLKQCTIHNQNPIVTMCNRQNLNNFEMKSRKPGLNGQTNQNQNQNQNNSHNQNNNFMQNNRNNYNQNPNMTSGQRPPLIQRPMRPNGPLLNNQPRMPTLSHQSMSFGSNNQQWNQMMPNGPRNNPMQSGANQLNPMLRLSQGNRQMPNQPLLSAPASQVDLRTQLSSGMTGMGGVQHTMSAAAAALFSSQTGLVPPTSDLFGNRMGPTMGPFGTASHATNDFTRSTMEHLTMQMSEAEFDEILIKNKNLSSNAVSKALNDVASGDFSAAIDTLSTAISLIKSSRIAHDERCKIIVSTLQDTLQGIEQKSYSGSSDRGRDGGSSGGLGSRGGSGKDRMARSRSRDRDHRGGSSHRAREKDRRRDRSHSRDRDYRERSRDRYHEDHGRDRDRSHYDDRYRDKDRDRDHRGRH